MREEDVERAWIKACIVGELLGFVPPALTGAALMTLEVGDIVLVVGLVAAGVLEGLILGLAQRRVLRRTIPGVSHWAVATASAAGLAWLAGMGGSALLEEIGPLGFIVAVPAWVVGLLAMGVLQWRELSPRVSGSEVWVPVTTIAWLVGVAIPVFALSLVPNSWPVTLHVGVAIVSAVLMGATVGVISAPTLARLKGRYDQEASASKSPEAKDQSHRVGYTGARAPNQHGFSEASQ